MIDFNEIGKYKENNRIEAKKALGGLPESIWETYSAFANTLGGILLLGVEELPGKTLRCIDLPDPENMVRRFHALLQDRTKVSADILSKDDVQIHEIGGNHMISIHVPRAQRTERPVYIGRDAFSGTYRRNGEGDYRCTEEEVRAMLRDAAVQTPDLRICEEFRIGDLRRETIARCCAGGDGTTGKDCTDFLIRTGGAAIGADGKPYPTGAGILLFGEIGAILSLYPEYRLSYTDPSGKTKWYETNILDFYFAVCAEIAGACPAAADPDIRRGICEAFSNCLINTDYYAPGGIRTEAGDGCIAFSNPGSFRIRKESAYTGGVSDPRNAGIFRSFQYMGIGKGTGSGLQNIYYVWKQHGFAVPEIQEEFQPDRITILLPLTGAVRKSKIHSGSAEIEAGTAAIIEYLTKNVSATTSQLSGALGFSLQDTRGFLAVIRTKEIVTESPNGSGIFRLKA